MPACNEKTGRVRQMHDLAGGGVLIGKTHETPARLAGNGKIFISKAISSLKTKKTIFTGRGIFHS
jgi:hypothetical protein